MNRFQQRIIKFIQLFFLGSFFEIILILFLYLRPSPFGTPYVLNIHHYIYHAIYYAFYGMALTATPFVILSLFIKKESVLKILYFIHSFFIFISLIISQTEHELMRFMGQHLTYDYLLSYGTFSGVPEAIWNFLKEDSGGSYLSLILFIVPLFFISIAIIIRNLSLKINTKVFNLLLFIIVINSLFLPYLFRTELFGGKNRQEKVNPAVIIARRIFYEFLDGKPTYKNIDKKISMVLKWKNEAKKSLAKCKSLKKQRPNIILIVLETFRARNIKLFNPNVKYHATPFIESLARSDKGVYWNRFISNGQPTIYSFISIHTSIPPHSKYNNAKKFTQTQFETFVTVLKKYGYDTAYFTASDPDWDNQRFWLNKWYDYIYFNPDDDEKDHLLFNAFTSFLMKKDSNKKPFLATIFTISNHIPFNCPKEKQKLYKGSELKYKIYNTMHYDDNVLHEFFSKIKSKPWFDNTIFIITGDHGYDLGERGESVGHTNIRHETDWVPLIIYGNNLKLYGKQETVASHIDLAPTILDLANICEKHAFLGTSLFNKNKEKSWSINIKAKNYAYETDEFSAYFPKNGDKYLYSKKDFLQNNNIYKNNKKSFKTMEKRAKITSEVIDYLVEHNKLNLLKDDK